MRTEDTTELAEEELLALVVFPELVGGLSHDVAQPLNAISLACEVIRIKVGRLALNETDLNFFENKLASMKNQVVKATDTINGIRRYASRSLNASTCDIETSFLRVCNLLRQQFISKGIEFTVQNRDGVMAPSRIDAIVLELVIAQCIVFARNQVEFLESRHKENTVHYDKRIETQLVCSPCANSIVIKWNRGTLLQKDMNEFIPPRSMIGLIASKKIIGQLGGALEMDDEHISLIFESKDTKPHCLG